MRQYFINLFRALWGNNPYLEDLQDLKDKMKSAASNIEEIRLMYYTCQQSFLDAGKEIESLQKLVEILRRHLSEKDEQMEALKQEYNERIDEYKKRIASLQEELGKLKNSNDEE